MSALGIIGEEIDKHVALARAALREVSGSKSTKTLPRALLDVLGPYSASLYIAERIIESESVNAELVETLHSKLIPLEEMTDRVLASARQQGHAGDPEVAEPFRWLEICNEQVKDCMVALEAMLDPELDDLMNAAVEEHRRGETVPLDSLR